MSERVFHFLDEARSPVESDTWFMLCGASVDVESEDEVATDFFCGEANESKATCNACRAVLAARSGQ